MGAELLVNLPVLPFGKKMQIHLAHDRTVLIRIARGLLRPVPSRETEMIWDIARCAWHSRAKESVLVAALCCNRLLQFSIKNDVDRAHIWPKHSNLQIVAHPMGPQHAEWIGVSPGDGPAHLVTRHTGYVESFHALFKSVGRLCQFPKAFGICRNTLQFPRPNH